MKEYKKGDRICLFGFSSGAYVARALARMLHVVGLLVNDDKGSIDAAYELYAQDNVQFAKLFKEARSTLSSMKIEFVGVWETTNESSETLHITKPNPSIKTFRHALALDERRDKLAPLYYTTDPKNESAIEVWFCGGHDDVGGGSNNPPAVSTGSPAVGSGASLARITLRWMIGECVDANAGILFKKNDLQTLLMDSTKDDSFAAEHCPIQHPPTGMQKLLQRLRAREPPRILSPDEMANEANETENKAATTVENEEANESVAAASESTVRKGAVYCHTTVKTRKEKFTNYKPEATLPDDTEYVESKLSSLAKLLGLADPIQDQPSGSGLPDKGKKQENAPQPKGAP